jgi:prepilin-type N-terminal cleavage/methylation domain-containing protein
MIRQQSGFTLIELVICLGIMAVLMTLAITSYSGYSQRASVSTGIALTSSIKLSVQEYFMKNNRFPLTNEAAGLFAANQYTDTHVRSISINETPSPGTITITYKGAGAISEGDSLLLIPSGDASGIRWKCTSFTLLASLLPATCR